MGWYPTKPWLDTNLLFLKNKKNRLNLKFDQALVELYKKIDQDLVELLKKLVSR